MTTTAQFSDQDVVVIAVSHVGAKAYLNDDDIIVVVIADTSMDSRNVVYMVGE